MVFWVFLKRFLIVWVCSFSSLAAVTVIDLTQIESEVALYGPWTYHIGALNETQMREDGLKTVRLPHFFEEEVGSAHGVVTLELSLQTQPGVPLAMDMQRPFSVWRLYVDGAFAAASGEIDASHHRYVPHDGLRFVSFTPSSEVTHLTLQVGNALHKHLGFYGVPIIAPAEYLVRKIQINTVIETAIASILTFFGLYHIALFMAWRRDKAPLWFGLLCVVFALRAMTTGTQALLFYMPQTSWETMIHLEYFSGYSALPLFVLYIGSLYPKQSSRHAEHFYLMLSILFVWFVIFTPISLFTASLNYYELIVLTFIVYTFVVLYRSHKAKEPGSKLAFFAFIVFSSCIVHDLLRFQNLLPTSTDLLSFGFLFYLMAQGGILLGRYADAFKTIASHKENLEHLVDTRTQELRIALDQHRLLLRELTHRVKNNLQFIMGLIGILRKQNEADPKVLLGRLELQIQAIASVHETLCNQGRFEAVEMDRHIASVAEYLKRFYPTLGIALDASPMFVKSDHAVALGLIFNELVANHVKYASADLAPIRVNIKNEGAYAVMIYSDGYDHRSALEASKEHVYGSLKLGWPMIRAFVRQMDGEISADEHSVRIQFAVCEV